MCMRLHHHVQAELQQVAEALRQSTKQLCRNLKDNPNVQENMAKVGGIARGNEMAEGMATR